MNLKDVACALLQSEQEAPDGEWSPSSAKSFRSATKILHSNSGITSSFFTSFFSKGCSNWFAVFHVQDFLNAVPGLQEEQAHRLMVNAVQDFIHQNETPMGLSEAMVAIGHIKEQLSAIVSMEKMEVKEMHLVEQQGAHLQQTLRKATTMLDHIQKQKTRSVVDTTIDNTDIEVQSHKSVEHKGDSQKLELVLSRLDLLEENQNACKKTLNELVENQKRVLELLGTRRPFESTGLNSATTSTMYVAL